MPVSKHSEDMTVRFHSQYGVLGLGNSWGPHERIPKDPHRINDDKSSVTSLLNASTHLKRDDIVPVRTRLLNGSALRALKRKGILKGGLKVQNEKVSLRDLVNQRHKETDNIDERLRALVVTVKRWAAVADLTNPTPGRWISNFTLTILVVYFMQYKKLLSPVNKVERDISEMKKETETNRQDYSLAELATGVDQGVQNQPPQH
ncbi:hypothetical protein RvY_14166 [Ramazzottius varieornatus]|uniref:Uncharacterized protein n=1 Tax=Ramazzottius varieornatus TaxID=947166 RepID=A0A1D1VSD9_RAMVA|nr:hypothetical protein RvY_14166 [Ramazzottius varieornatus]